MLYVNSKKAFIVQSSFLSVNKDKTILLVGLGAIGSVIYRRLSLQNYNIVCLTSMKSAKLIRRKGLRVKLSDDDTLKLHNCEIYGELPDKLIFDRCIFTAKSWMNEFILENIQKNLNSSCSFLLLQNGLNIEQPFLKSDYNWKVFRGLTSLAAYRQNKNEVYESSIGNTVIGSMNNDDEDLLEEWRSLLQDIGLPVSVTDNIHRDIWLKAAVNCTIGPLSAITDLNNGQILPDMFLSRILNYLLQEILLVIPENLSIKYNDAMNLIEKIANETSHHKSSMLQDIEAGNNTEIDVLNGQILKLAEEKGIDVPINRKVVDFVKLTRDKSVPKEQIILELRSL